MGGITSRFCGSHLARSQAVHGRFTKQTVLPYVGISDYLWECYFLCIRINIIFIRFWIVVTYNHNSPIAYYTNNCTHSINALIVLLFINNHLHKHSATNANNFYCRNYIFLIIDYLNNKLILYCFEIAIFWGPFHHIVFINCHGSVQPISCILFSK